MGKPWTKKEDRLLMDGAGVFSVEWFKRKTGRSTLAIYTRANKLYGTGGLSRGTYSLAEASRETGYAEEQLTRAQSALDQKWKRLSGRGKYLITFEQLDLMVGWLQHDYWCSRLRLYGCVNCGSARRPTRGMGLCPRDYWRVRRECKKLGLPSSGADLKVLTAGLGYYSNTEVRALEERLERGWGPTVEQLKQLAIVVSASS